MSRYRDWVEHLLQSLPCLCPLSSTGPKQKRTQSLVHALINSFYHMKINTWSKINTSVYSKERGNEEVYSQGTHHESFEFYLTTIDKEQNVNLLTVITFTLLKYDIILSRNVHEIVSILVFHFPSAMRRPLIVHYQRMNDINFSSFTSTSLFSSAV